MLLPALVAAVLAGVPGADGNLPEPMLVESITDVDARESGELELELTTAAQGFTPRSPYAMRIEAEWRLTRLLGLKLEAGFDHSSAFVPSLAAGASFALFHLERLGLHAQAVLYVRWPFEGAEIPVLDPAEPTTIAAAGVHLAWQWHLLSARAEVTGGYGGDVAHAPIRANAALLFGTHVAFAGVELLSDFARANPLLLAIEGVLRERLDDVPFSVAVAVPFQPRPGGTAAVLVRVLLAFD